MIPLRDSVVSRTRPFFNWMFILINVYVFYLELQFKNGASLEAFIRQWSVIPVQLWADLPSESVKLVTATFLHGGWMHIIGNMLFLYIFGDNVEDRMGHTRYFFFYLLVGVLANAAQAYFSAGSKIPLLGASGAIAGILGAYFFYYPYARVVTLIPFGIFSRIVEVPAFLFLGIWFLMQAINSVGALSPSVKTMQDVGGVAWLAHAAGFVGGLLLGPIFAIGRSQSKSPRYR